MSSVSAVADRPTVTINYAYEPTQTQMTIPVMRRPKRRSLARRAVLGLLVLVALAVALFITAGIIGTVTNHPAAPAANYPAVPVKAMTVHYGG